MNYSSTHPKKPATGMMFYNTDRVVVQVYDGSQWLDLTNDLVITADILWSAVLSVEAEREEAEREEAERACE